MTPFLDVRLRPVGGELATSVAIYNGSSLSTYQPGSRQELLTAIRGRNVLVGTHGFNVDRAGGIDDLDTWGNLFLGPAPVQELFIGLLWPGDSVWAHGLDYPAEPRVADDTGRLVAPFLDELLADAASVSFVSHSLGARVILQTVLQMTLRPHRVILMAGAIDDDCLTDEFQAASKKVDQISVLASKKDAVLGLAFPLGNFFAGLMDQGHPWWHDALGRNGPQRPRPANFRAPFLIPGDWHYGHKHYLQVDPAAVAPALVDTDVPPEGTLKPVNGSPGWQQTFSSGFAATRFKG